MSAVNPEGDGRVGVSQKLKPVFVILKEIQKKKKIWTNQIWTNQILHGDCYN